MKFAGKAVTKNVPIVMRNNAVYETDPSGRDPCHLTLAISCRKDLNYEFRSLQMMANQIGPVD